MDRQSQQAQNEREEEERQYNTFLYKFQQQIIDAWKPVPYTKNNVILYTILTIICVVVGLVLILTAPQTPEINLQYSDSTPGDGNTITVNFTLSQALSQPVYLYYGFTNFYQNHRRFIKFFSTDQMNGKQITSTTAIDSCGSDAYTNSQIGATKSYDNSTTLNSSDVAYPCGQRAKSYLKVKPEIDTIALSYSNGTGISLSKTGIAWPDDLNAYKNSASPTKQAISNQDQAWLVWYRPAAKNNFFKLHSIIYADLPEGTYSFSVVDNYDSSFGQKYFYLGKSNYMGNRDYFLGIAFLVLAAGCLIVLIIFIAKCVTEMRSKPKED